MALDHDGCSPMARPLVPTSLRSLTGSTRCFSGSSRVLSDEAYMRMRPSSTHRSRYLTHYRTSLAPDLLYLTYDHQNTVHPPSPPELPAWDSANPHTKNRSRPRVKTALVPAARPTTDKSLVDIESITLSIHVKAAAGQKNHLLPAIMYLRAISGQHAAGLPQSHLGPSGLPEGVQVVRTRPKSASFKIRSGQPIGAKVTLSDPAAITSFLETLSETVMPRLKEWDGVALPQPARGETMLPSYHSGAVTFGLPPQAMGLWPQVEVNLDAYPRQYGLQVNVVSNTTGANAQDRVRALLSGYRIPFVVHQ